MLHLVNDVLLALQTLSRLVDARVDIFELMLSQVTVLAFLLLARLSVFIPLLPALLLSQLPLLLLPLFEEVGAALLLLVGLQDLVDQLVHRGRALPIFDCRPSLHDGVLQLDA